jgi:hypothetical protein
VTAPALVVLSALLACIPCAAHDSTPNAAAESIAGVWEMIEFEMTQGSKTTRQTADGEPLAVSIYTSDHFAYVWRGRASAGAGTYVSDGATITQTFEYLADEALTGSVFTFDLDIEGDLMRFSGPRKAVNAAGEDITDRIPQMVEVRRRSAGKRH